MLAIRVSSCRIIFDDVRNFFFRISRGHLARRILQQRSTSLHELRRYRLCHWPRNYPWFRRSRQAIQQGRQSCGVVAVTYERAVYQEGRVYNLPVWKLYRERCRNEGKRTNHTQSFLPHYLHSPREISPALL